MKVIEIGNKILKLELNNQSSWYKIPESCTEAIEVYKTLIVGDEVDVKYTVINDVSMVNQLKKTGSPAEAEVREEVISEDAISKNIGQINNFDKPIEVPEYTCKKCGKVMTNDKYEYCYTCNQTEKSSVSRISENIKIAAYKLALKTVIYKANTNSDNEIFNDLDSYYAKYIERLTK